ncbi:MAG: hypothetical protein ACU85E_02865 [Gammaproteobacteria bacterium]
MKSFVYLAVFLSLAPATKANESVEIKFDSLPAAVQNTVSNVVEKHHIYKIEKITDESHVKFEIQSTKPIDKNKFVDTDITAASNGRIIKLRKDVSTFKLPFKVMKQITHQYPDIQIDKVQSVELRFYELTGTVQGQKLRFKILENGEIQEIPPANLE